MILPNRIEGETMSVNKEHTMSTYSKHSILGDTRINITNYVSFIRVYFNESFLNLIIIQKQLIEAVRKIQKVYPTI